MPNDVKYSIRYGFMDGMNLARQLAENLRVRRGSPTQEALARKLGISRATLTRRESAAQNTTIKTLERSRVHYAVAWRSYLASRAQFDGADWRREDTVPGLVTQPRRRTKTKPASGTAISTITEVRLPVSLCTDPSKGCSATRAIGGLSRLENIGRCTSEGQKHGSAKRRSIKSTPQACGSLKTSCGKR